MKLIDLLNKMYADTPAWISNDPDPDADGWIYFGPAGDAPVRIVKGLEVVEFYVESYPALGGRSGISIIVQRGE